MIIHYTSGLCVTSADSKDLVLMKCSEAAEKNDGRNKFYFGDNGSIISEYDKQECVYIKDNNIAKNLAYSATVEVSSTLGDGGHDGFRSIGKVFSNLDGNTNTFWASTPGNEYVTFSLQFDKWVTADSLFLKWKYIAKNFDLFVLTYEKGWRHVFKIVGNSIICLLKPH